AARMNHERRPRLALRDHRCAEHFLLVVGPRVGRTDLADQAGTNAGVTRARGDIGDYLAREIVDRAAVHVRGMGGGYVVARAHYHVEPGGARDPREGPRVAADRGRRRVDDGAAARLFEKENLIRCSLLVLEAKIVEVGVEVLANPAEVGEAYSLPRARLVGGRRRLGGPPPAGHQQ